jgi:hypothetical protein
MQKQAFADRLNLIANLFHLGLPSVDEPAIFDVFGANLEYPLSLIGEARQEFQSSVDDLLNLLSSVKGTISREFIIGETPLLWLRSRGILKLHDLADKRIDRKVIAS